MLHCNRSLLLKFGSIISSDIYKKWQSETKYDEKPIDIFNINPFDNRKVFAVVKR